MEARVLEQRATLREVGGRRTEALNEYGAGRRAYEQARDYEGRGRMAEKMALSAEAAGALEQAAAYYRQAEESYTAARNTQAASSARSSLERVYRWGFLADLQERRIYGLGGERASLGRDVPSERIVNTISIGNRPISRHHLTISRGGAGAAQHQRHDAKRAGAALRL